MFLVNLKRIIRAGLLNFWRNRFISMSSVVVMTITLMIVGLFVFSNVLFNSALDQIKSKVDINVYFVTEAKEENITLLKETLENMPEVAMIEYVSREQALESFRERHQDDQITLQALDELDENPLGAILNIRAKETSQYEGIASFLDNQNTLSEGSFSIIDKINYHQNKVAINKLSRIISMSEKFGLGVAIIFVIFSVIITFHTIRLAIYVARDEISVMRLIGASNTYVRGPFVVEGVAYGLVSSIIALVLFLPFSYWIGSYTSSMFGIDIYNYYLNNSFYFISVLLSSGILLGVVSSYLAVNKYLKV
ncbi:cell division protein FtsX [Patescibacteria group bacterium]